MTALERCVGDTSRFLDEYWGKRAHLHRGSGLGALLSLDDADTLLSSTALRAPAFRVAKDGVTIDPASCTRRARIGSRTVTDLIDPGRVYDLFATGATIVLQGLHRYWEPVAELCRALEAELTHPLQANAYITPPVAQGLRLHADRHDVFAVQTHGRKQWVVEEPPLDLELEPGDSLYIPTGVRHAARTVDSPSIHLTLGVRTATWGEVLDRAVRLDADPLPAGFAHDPARLRAEAAERLAALAETIRAADAGALLDDAADAFWARRTPTLRGQLQQVLAAGDIDDGTPLRLRPHATSLLRIRGDTVEVVLGDRTLRMPAAVEPVLRRITELGELKPADLGDLLDEAGRLTLVRRLVREGLLMAGDG